METDGVTGALAGRKTEVDSLVPNAKFKVVPKGDNLLGSDHASAVHGLTQSFSAGKVIEDRYELVSRLGEGGAGHVWLAKDQERRITVAVKVLRPELSKRKEMLEQFQREAELSARMMSPNIVKVFARGVDGHGTPYIVYELLDGEDLATRLENKPRLDLVETETVLVHVARALSRAHGVGVVHRDIKPANIYLTRDEDGRLLAKVLDFGVAEIIAKTGASEELSGTLEYMAPELILEGKAPDARTDLYSAAVVAYRCLAGDVPFTGDTLGQVMLALATTQAKPLSERLGCSLPELDDWFSRAFAKDPAFRFATARELAESFHAAAKAGKKRAPELAGAAPESTRGGDPRVFASEVIRMDHRKVDALPPPSHVPDYATVRRGLPANMPPLPMNPPRPSPRQSNPRLPAITRPARPTESDEQVVTIDVDSPVPPVVAPAAAAVSPPPVVAGPVFPASPPTATVHKPPPPLPRAIPRDDPASAKPAIPFASPRNTMPMGGGPTHTAPLPPRPANPAPLPPMRPRAQSFVFDEELDGDLLKKDDRRD
jgi:serine/threonine-protein kinase